jgi:hypothetical protein
MCTRKKHTHTRNKISHTSKYTTNQKLAHKYLYHTRTLNPRRREKEGRKRRKSHANFDPWGMYLIAPLFVFFLPFLLMLSFSLLFKPPPPKGKRKKKKR